MASGRGEYCYPYPMPAVTADIVLFTVSDQSLKTLLIRRAKEPMQGRWAFPGGFVDELEPLEQAARRELAEETGIELDASRLHQFGAYGDPGRDPRGWTVSIAFYGVVDMRTSFNAADDASDAGWHDAVNPPDLAFDHGEILADAVRRLRLDAYRLPIFAPLFSSPADMKTWARVVAVATGESDVTKVRSRLVRSELLERSGDSKPFRYRYAML